MRVLLLLLPTHTVSQHARRAAQKSAVTLRAKLDADQLVKCARVEWPRVCVCLLSHKLVFFIHAPRYRPHGHGHNRRNAPRTRTPLERVILQYNSKHQALDDEREREENIKCVLNVECIGRCLARRAIIVQHNTTTDIVTHTRTHTTIDALFISITVRVCLSRGLCTRIPCRFL